MSKLTITLLSDWHIGSGTGIPGGIDRLIQRDAHNLPYIPAKTLTGILRDGCELVVAGLDEGQTGRWHEWLEYLFGSQPPLEAQGTEKTPIPAALSIRSAHFPKSLQQALNGKRELQAALTFVKPGVAIDPNSGTAKPDYLRFEEMARSGSYLEAEYALPLMDDSQTRTAQALLLAGATVAERIGAKRRRGAGKCEIKLAGLDLTELLHDLEQTPPDVPLTLLDDPGEIEHQTPSENWHEIELQIETQSPLIIHARTLGNLVSTLDYIPGTALLPIVAKQLGSIVNVGQAIANNQLIVTNATREVEEQAGRPMPFALFQEKQNRQNIYNRLGESNTEDDQTPNRPQLKGLRAGYVGQNAYSVGSTGVTTHNTVEDKTQRPNETVGGVYSYEAISPQTKFRSKIHIQSPLISQADAAKCLGELATVNQQIGRSKKDDYGLVKITIVDPISKTEIPIASNKELRVWLLSDVLIRNSRLRPSTNPADLITELGAKLGVELKLQPDSMSSVTRSKRTDSWQTRWGLPRPSLVGLSAGSCFLVTADREISGETLAKLERTGIGERTVEGYGRLCFNDPLLMEAEPKLTEDRSSVDSSSGGSAPLSTNLDQYVQTIEREAWREAIRRTSLSLAADPVKRREILGITIDDRNGLKESKPSMSQLGVLRSIVMTVIKADFSHNLDDWLSSLTDKWTQDSLEKIRPLLNDSDRIWSLLESIDFDRLTLTTETALQQALWLEAVQILVISCLRAHKRDVE